MFLRTFLVYLFTFWWQLCSFVRSVSSFGIWTVLNEFSKAKTSSVRSPSFPLRHNHFSDHQYLQLSLKQDYHIAGRRWNEILLPITLTFLRMEWRVRWNIICSLHKRFRKSYIKLYFIDWSGINGMAGRPIRCLKHIWNDLYTSTQTLNQTRVLYYL